MTAACHVGFRRLWETMLAHRQQTDASRTPVLLSQVSLFWSWMSRLTGEATAGHLAVSRSREADRLQLAHQFVSALLSD